MLTDKEEAKQKIAKLVADYQALTSAQVKTYHEAKTKQGFVEPLFRSLGWDFDDVEEVAPEESASKGRVDYAFKLKGVSRFYLEAKPLKADLNNPEYIKQAITYAYNKGVTWAALGSFDRLRLFNAQTGQPFLNLTCEQYLDDFDRLWLLSKESITDGALDKEAAKVGALPPPQPVEKRLFQLLRQWREELFSQAHGYNRQLSFAQIDEVIQRLFNRLIFIRTCEDREIEERTLLAAVNQWESGSHKPELVDSLRNVFRQFDGYYDSDLFTLHPLDQAFIEGDTLARIIRGLYEIAGGVASYDFSVIDADVLGAVYEQYLGHVATTVKEKAKQVQAQLSLGLPGVESISLLAKKQKRKEQGIYYTPKWITDYIVKQTVGRFLGEHHHNENIDVKVLDLACGSGSFLIRAYDELLGYHARVKGKPVVGLDQWDRLPVLTGNIFGVDLDPQAVEIARLNLLLRSVAHREILPTLADNVRQGNSLISGGETDLKAHFGKSWKDKRPFVWEEEFPVIMKKGGFDVVIGNPPYVRIQTLDREDADYYRNKYEAAFGSFDIYVLFLQRGIELLKPGGRLGFICSSKFLKSVYGDKILRIIRRECTVESILDLSAGKVFAEATTYPAIVVLKKGKDDAPLKYVSMPAELVDSSLASGDAIRDLPPVVTDQAALLEGMWPPLAKGDTLWEKLTQNTEPLGKLAARIFQGLITSADKVYILEKREAAKNGLVRVYSRATEQTHEIEDNVLKPFLTGKNISRYFSPLPTDLLLFPYTVSDRKATLISQLEFESKYPGAWDYLNANRATLEQRENGGFHGEDWYRFGRNQNLGIHGQPKLAIPSTVKRLAACYDSAGSMYLDNVRVNGILLKRESGVDYRYVLALLNSRLLHWFFAHRATPFANGWFGANRQFIESLPVRRISLSNESEKNLHKGLVGFAERMMYLHKELHETSPVYLEKRHEIEREIARTDDAIDTLVYDLYGLTKEEKQIVGTAHGN